jgi:hypothetical protein
MEHFVKNFASMAIGVIDYGDCCVFDLGAGVIMTPLNRLKSRSFCQFSESLCRAAIVFP